MHSTGNACDIVRSKVYHDRAVQTDDNPSQVHIEEHAKTFQDDALLSAQQEADFHCHDPSLDLQLRQSSPVENAYIQLATSESPALDKPAQRNLRYPHQLRPSSTFNTKEQRIVSLPNKDSASMGTKFVAASFNRVVSLPERFDVETIIVDQSNRGNDSHDSCSYAPHTLSPPSSPESVMIIGNNSQVSHKFLRSKSSGNHKDGWMTWASSPPKPIPALHGPLSLPYARCPSGAEGTLIEGADDLPRMIWGLGEVEAHSTAPRRNGHASNQSPQRHNKDMYSKHDALHSYPPRALDQGSNPPSVHHTSNVQFPQLSPPADAIIEDENLAKRARSLSLADAYDLGQSHTETIPSNIVFNGTGMMNSNCMLAGQPIPSYKPRIFICSHSDTSTFHSAQRAFSTDRACHPDDHSYPPNKLECISPSSSASTQWTPIFSAYEDRLDTPAMNEQYVPHVETFDSYTSIHHQDEHDPIYSRAGLNLRNVNLPFSSIEKISKDPAADFGTTIHIGNTAVRILDAHRPGPPPDFPLPTPPATHENILNSPNPQTPSHPVDDIHSRGFDKQSQPRSVPLAKLIQRRLATVPEESHTIKQAKAPRAIRSPSVNAPYFQNQVSMPRTPQILPSPTVAPSNSRQQFIEMSPQSLRSPNTTYEAIKAARQNMERSVGLNVSGSTQRNSGSNVAPLRQLKINQGRNHKFTGSTFTIKEKRNASKPSTARKLRGPEKIATQS